MSQKDLETEFKHLANEFKELKELTEKLFKKYEILENKYKKCLKSKANASFICRICDQECESVKDLQEHKKAEHSTDGEYKCDECEQLFNSMHQLEKHEKSHEKFECEDCDKIFSYEGLLERHMEAVHSDTNSIIFCHYYNNDKECPFGDICIFEHDEAENCKYGKACERKMCMYSHNADENEDNCDEENENKEFSYIDVEKLKPVLEKVKLAVEKCDTLIEECSFKCKNCEFVAKDKNGLNMHIRAKHPTKAK